MNLHKLSNILIFFFFVFFWFTIQSQKSFLTFPSQHKLKVTFGSCNKFYETDNSTIFNSIASYKPDLFIWLGDVAYVEDMIIYYAYFKFPGIENARKKLENAKKDPAYENMRRLTPVIGVWDNHDYGADGGDKTFPHKYEMKEAFLDFLDEPKNSSRRLKEGIYESYTITLEGLRVNFVLLDARFNRDPETNDVLGKEQWDWLEKEFEKGDDIYFIGSGSQVLPDDRILHDNWYTESTKKLVELIQYYNVSVVLLSGDVHLGEILSLPCSTSLLGYQLYEITSSGLTHTSRDHFPRGELFDKLFFPETYNRGKDRFVDYNFGSIEIEAHPQNKGQSKIKFQIRNINGSAVINKELTLNDLKRKTDPNVTVSSFKNSLCFHNSTKEQRFFSHLRKAILTQEIFLWLIVPIFGLILFFSGICYYCYKICCFKRSKLKTE